MYLYLYLIVVAVILPIAFDFTTVRDVCVDNQERQSSSVYISKTGEQSVKTIPEEPTNNKEEALPSASTPATKTITTLPNSYVQDEEWIVYENDEAGFHFMYPPYLDLLERRKEDSIYIRLVLPGNIGSLTSSTGGLLPYQGYMDYSLTVIPYAEVLNTITYHHYLNRDRFVNIVGEEAYEDYIYWKKENIGDHEVLASLSTRGGYGLTMNFFSEFGSYSNYRFSYMFYPVDDENEMKDLPRMILQNELDEVGLRLFREIASTLSFR